MSIMSHCILSRLSRFDSRHGLLTLIMEIMSFQRFTPLVHSGRLVFRPGWDTFCGVFLSLPWPPPPPSFPLSLHLHLSLSLSPSLSLSASLSTLSSSLSGRVCSVHRHSSGIYISLQSRGRQTDLHTDSGFSSHRWAVLLQHLCHWPSHGHVISKGEERVCRRHSSYSQG